MGWECRQGAGYYYRSRRVGGRTVKTYFGRGEVARMAEQLDAADRRGPPPPRRRPRGPDRRAGAAGSCAGGAGCRLRPDGSCHPADRRLPLAQLFLEEGEGHALPEGGDSRAGARAGGGRGPGLPRPAG